MADQNFFPVPRWCRFSSTVSTSVALVPRSFFWTMKVAMSAAYRNQTHLINIFISLKNNHFNFTIDDVFSY